MRVNYTDPRMQGGGYRPEESSERAVIEFGEQSVSAKVKRRPNFIRENLLKATTCFSHRRLFVVE